MKTEITHINLEKIKEIIFPKEEKIDMKRVAIDLILYKIGENKLVSFDKIFLNRKVNNEVINLEGLGVINDNLVIFATRYSENNYQLGNLFGVAAENNDTFDKNKGIGLPDYPLMKACQHIFNNERIHVEFDFNTMTSPDTWSTYLDELVNDASHNKRARNIINEFKKLKKGKIRGYFEFYDDRLY